MTPSDVMQASVPLAKDDESTLDRKQPYFDGYATRMSVRSPVAGLTGYGIAPWALAHNRNCRSSLESEGRPHS